MAYAKLSEMPLETDPTSRIKCQRHSMIHSHIEIVININYESSQVSTHIMLGLC